MRVACVSIANLAVQLTAIENPELRGKPIIIGGSPFDGRPVFDASPEALTCGIRMGMPLRQAYSLCPEALFFPANEVKYEDTFGRVLDILDNFSPIVERERLGAAYLDLTGIVSEQETARRISKAVLTGTGPTASIGVSSGKFFSHVAAVSSGPEDPVFVSSRSEREFIAPFSVEFLPCLPETRERLKLFGIKKIGQLASFSRDVLIAQFGADGTKMYELATGIDQSLLVPRKKPVFVERSVELYPPADSCFEVVKSCEILLGNLFTRMKTQGKLCREAALSLAFESGLPLEKKLPFKEATSSESLIMSRITAWLESTKLPASVTGVELKLFLCAETGKNLSLWQSDRDRRNEFVRVAGELKSRFGYQPLKKIEAADSGAIFPERRIRLVEVKGKE